MKQENGTGRLYAKIRRLEKENRRLEKANRYLIEYAEEQDLNIDKYLNEIAVNDRTIRDMTENQRLLMSKVEELEKEKEELECGKRRIEGEFQKYKNLYGNVTQVMEYAHNLACQLDDLDNTLFKAKYSVFDIQDCIKEYNEM